MSMDAWKANVFKFHLTYMKAYCESVSKISQDFNMDSTGISVVSFMLRLIRAVPV